MGQFLAVHQLRRLHQSVGVRIFSTEGQHIAAQRGQQRHPGGGKALGAKAGIRGRQGNNNVRPRLQRRAHPHRSRQQRKPAPLYRAIAHADSDGLHPGGTQHTKLLGMPVVKRIIFRNNSRKFHGITSMDLTPTMQLLRD